MKILFSLVLFLCCFSKIDAKTYYSEYSEFSDYSTVKIESNELILVETQRRYSWYLNIAHGDYYLLGENPIIYPYINVNIYRDQPFSQWEKEYPGDKYSRVIETKEVCDTKDCSSKHIEYRYRDRLYYHYLKEKKKKDGYYVFLEGHEIDENDYQDFYRYRSREKIEIPDSIVITKEEKIEDLILSTVDYEILGEIDYSKNGLYQVNIKTDFLEIPIVVNVLKLNLVKGFYEQELVKKDIVLEDQKKQLEIFKKELITVKENYQQKLEENRVLKINHKQELTNYEILMQKKMNSCESNFLKISEEIKICQEEKLVQDKQIVDLMKNISNKNVFITNIRKELIGAKEEVKKAEMIEESYDNCVQRYDDVEKKYALCQNNYTSLEQSLLEKNQIVKQNVFFVSFLFVLIGFVVCFLMRIKSMKKKD